MKRLIALVLTLVLLMAALPGAASAAKMSRDEAMRQQVKAIYDRCLELAEVESFEGLCGLLTSMQLWQMGINDHLAATCDGNQQFDAYAGVRVTSGGYHVIPYPATDFTLEQALNLITKNGTVDAKNILVGFEATSTDLGGTYGHACVIHAIINGNVYFVENYNTFFGGPEGTVNVCTIKEFANLYADWTVFDGVIHFGDSLYADSCQQFPTDVFVRTRFVSTLRSEPCLLSEKECIRLRTLAAGELLHATALLVNDRKELYYRVEEGGREAYVAANAVSLNRVNPEALLTEELEIPTTLKVDGKLTLKGIVRGETCGISALELVITDAEGNVLHEAKQEVKGTSYDLEKLNKELSKLKLEEKGYILSVYATASHAIARGTKQATKEDRQLVYTGELSVGNAPKARLAPEPEAQKPRNGWFYENGTWYYYRAQKPVSGWLTYLGVDYYLNKDGSVTTGWAEIDGWQRYFTETGAMCTGWLTLREGTRCWLDDGTEAWGLQEIDGKLYYFDDDFLLVTYGTVTVDGVTYEIQEDGTALEVPEEKAKN